jgi:hypothetical protein
MCSLILQTARAFCCVLLTVLSGVVSAQTTGTVNPSTVTAKPNPSSLGPSADEEPPPGGCMPIGVTVSGEIVFPFQCKGFIERQKAAADKKSAAAEDQPAAAEAKPAAAQVKPLNLKPTAEAAEERPATADTKPAAAEEKGAAAEDQPAAAEQKPAAAAEKTAARQSEGAAPVNGKPAVEWLEAVPLPLPRRADLKPAGPPGCTHFRSYDPVSGTYRAYGGQRRQCR